MPSETITITPTGVWCGTLQYANYFSSMWCVGSKFFTSGEIGGPVVVAFKGGAADHYIGPFPSVRLVGPYLFQEGQLLASVEHDKWEVDGQRYDAVLVSPG